MSDIRIIRGVEAASVPDSLTEDKVVNLSSYGLEIEPLHRVCHEGLVKLGITELFPVQKICASLIISRLHAIALSPYDCDLCISAPTGQGKTLAYLLPIVHVLSSLPKKSICSNKLSTLIVLPTRDLALQVASVARSFSPLPVYCLVGENSMSEERQQLKNIESTSGPQICVATLGRLVDHLVIGSLTLEDLQWLVVDEADRMLSQADMDKWGIILRTIPDTAQRLLFSATMTTNPMKLGKLRLTRPLFVSVSPRDGIAGSIPDGISHKYVVVPNSSMKLRCFLRLLEIVLTGDHESLGLPPIGRCLVLCKSTENVTSMLELLKKLNKISQADLLKPAAFSGNLSAQEREKLLSKFTAGSVNCLVSTDVITRGIDIADIDMVVNFDAPRHATTYVHRAGRTGRAGKSGVVLTLCENTELGPFKKNVIKGCPGMLTSMTKIRMDFKTVMKHSELEAVEAENTASIDM